MVYRRHISPKEAGQDKRTQQQGEYLTQDLEKRSEKADIGMRLDQREDQRYDHRRQQVGEQRIGRQARGATTQLARNDSRRRRRRTDKTDHSPLEHLLILDIHRYPEQEGGQHHTRE